MRNRGDSNLGDEIRNIVQDAVNNRDFNRLNRDIGNVVNGALDEVGRSFGRNRDRHQRRNDQSWKVNDEPQNQDRGSRKWNSNQGQQWDDNNSWTRKRQASNHQTYNNYHRNNDTNKPVPKPVKFTVPVGQVSGTLFTVFGALGTVASVITAIVFAMIGYFTGKSGVYTFISFGLLPCILACVGLSFHGSRIRKRLNRFQRYLSQIHDRNYCLIKDLSLAIGRSNKYTIKDLQKMISIGMFPEGHIDDQETCFMLNRESYEQYLNLQERMRMKDMEEQAKKSEQTMPRDKMQEDKNNKKDTLDPVIRNSINEGRQYVQKIRNANIEIPGEEISLKLDRLEAVTGKIFDYIEIHPEKYPEIKKFTEYFLPTTLKLLDAYREFDYQPVEGENLSAAKKEIEKTMDTINLAFENLLDGLFEDAAMDVSTDISVMETMFAQEGLTENNIRNKTMGEEKNE